MFFWKRQRIEGYERWTGLNSMMQITIAPELGSKVISLKNVRTGREWLAQPDQGYGNGGYASSFAASDGSGWDEIFPTVNGCNYQTFPWQGVELPDHGEVWSLPWQTSAQDGKLRCEVHGIRFPYHLSKTYSFTEEERLRIDYRVRNLSPFPFSFLWAAHPLFRVKEGMEMIVPSELNKIVVSYSQNRRLGEMGDAHFWPNPCMDAGEIRLDRIESEAARTAEKFYFQGELPEGRAALYDPGTKERLTLLFPKEKVPYLSIWANYGGYRNQYHVALEPATGFLDDLSYAMEHGQAAIIKEHGTYHWFLEIEMSLADQA